MWLRKCNLEDFLTNISSPQPSLGPQSGKQSTHLKNHCPLVGPNNPFGSMVIAFSGPQRGEQSIRPDDSCVLVVHNVVRIEGGYITNAFLGSPRSNQYRHISPALSEIPM